MYKLFFLLALATSIVPQKAFNQEVSIRESFEGIDSLPEIIICQNELKVNNRGGHQQGVQMLVKDGEEYAILSGSSGTYAYYAVADISDNREVRSIHELMEKPFKHAGGIQIYQDLMVVGIEDNEKRDRSKVCLYEIDDPEDPPAEPVDLFERRGDPLRSTAGCAGMTRIGDRYLVVVGDWDTKHLDFYLGEEGQPAGKSGSFRKVYTIDTENIDRSSWPDKAWHAYQNINLLKDTDGNLFLFGFGQNDRGENIGDLYLVKNKSLKEFEIVKIMSKTFYCKEGADFRAGAGVYMQPDGNLKVISCGSHINNSLILNIFD